MVTFRTQINSFDTLGITAFYLLAKHLYNRKYRKFTDEEQPLLNKAEEENKNLKKEIKRLNLELKQAKDTSAQQIQALTQFKYLEAQLVLKKNKLKEFSSINLFLIKKYCFENSNCN